MTDTQDPFGFFKACDITPKVRKKFDPYSIVLAGNLTYVSTCRYRLGNTPRDIHEMRQIECNKANFCIPVYTYIHGITLQSTRSWIGRAHHAEWDSAKSGFWYIPVRDIRAEGFTLTRKRKELITKALDSILTIIHDPDTDPDDEYVEWFRTLR